jgi:hypothetical protein
VSSPDRHGQELLIEAIEEAIEKRIHSEWPVTPIDVIGALELIKADYIRATLEEED